jgi:methyl-accepting chemotaxis protein
MRTIINSGRILVESGEIYTSKASVKSDWEAYLVFGFKSIKTKIVVAVTIRTMETNLERVDTEFGAIEAGGRHLDDILHEIGRIESLVLEMAERLRRIGAHALTTLDGVREISTVAEEVAAGAAEAASVAKAVNKSVERFRV